MPSAAAKLYQLKNDLAFECTKCTHEPTTLNDIGVKYYLEKDAAHNLSVENMLKYLINGDKKVTILVE